MTALFLPEILPAAAPSLVFVVPGPIDTRTGGYEYDRRIIDGLRRAGWDVSLHQLAATFPFPSSADRDEADRLFAKLPDQTTVLVDGLAFGALANEAERHATRLRFVALVHHPLAEETGLDALEAEALAASERRALATARLAIVTSAATADGLSRYGVPPERLVVVGPGTDRVAAAAGSGSPELHLLCVATLTPRKGHEVLLRALAGLRDRRWRLTLFGGLDRDRPTVSRIAALIAANGLEDRVRLAGEAEGDALNAHYHGADLFVLATWHEGYGMVVAEALAHGIPVISTRTGGIPGLVDAGGAGKPAGLLVQPGDEAALRNALARIMDEPALRDRLRDGALEAREHLRSWDDAVAEMERALRAGDRRRELTFSAEWLALREPADLAARPAVLAEALSRSLLGGVKAGTRVRVVDLGTGTGANIRALVARLGCPQDWVAADVDLSLLDEALARTREWAAGRGWRAALESGRLQVRGPGIEFAVSTAQFDLGNLGSREARVAAAADDPPPPFVGAGLVTAAAILHLLAESQVVAGAAICRHAGAAALFALTYDGRIVFSPSEPEDAAVRDLVNAHQRTDKGFGIALGPDATAVAERAFIGVGYHVRVERSDWNLGPESHELQRQLLTGWASAGTEMAPARKSELDAWLARRLAHVEGRQSRLVVGHQDLLATIE